MADHDLFVRAINEQPDEYMPRLVYADWLEENGYPLYAEFIRLQIEVSRSILDDERKAVLLKRESELWHQKRKWGRLPPNWTKLAFLSYHKGLLEAWSGSVQDFIRFQDSLWSFGPIRALSIAGTDAELAKFAQCESLSRIDTLEVWPARRINRSGLAIASSPHLSQLKELRFLASARASVSDTAYRALQAAFGDRVNFPGHAF